MYREIKGERNKEKERPLNLGVYDALRYIIIIFGRKKEKLFIYSRLSTCR